MKMIHIEGNWYISVGGYKNYTLGTYKKTTIVDREVELLENATYHSSLEKALQAYVEMSVSNLLKSHDLELMDALAVMRNEYARLTNVFQKVFAEPQVVYISLPQGTMPKLGKENALPDQPDKYPNHKGMPFLWLKQGNSSVLAKLDYLANYL